MIWQSALKTVRARFVRRVFRVIAKRQNGAQTRVGDPVRLLLFIIKKQLGTLKAAGRLQVVFVRLLLVLPSNALIENP